MNADILARIEEKLDKLLTLYIVPDVLSKDLYKALAQAQAEMQDMVFTGTNVHYKDKYATLSDLIRMSRPALTKYGLAVYQTIEQVDGIDMLKTHLVHESGQQIVTTMRIQPNKNTLHVIGSYIAYLRRLSYASLLGICVHDMDDDDGHTATQENIERIIKGVAPEATAKDTNLNEYKRLSKAQIAEIEQAMGNHYDLGQDLLSKYGVDGFGELPETKFGFILGQLRKNVAFREGQLI